LGWRLNTRDYKVRKWLDDRFPKPIKRAPVYRTSFDHDQTVDRVVTRLSEASVVEGFTPEQVLRSEVGRQCWHLTALERKEKRSAVPDAVLDLNVRDSPMKVALELELSRKTKKRIFQKLEHYLIQSEYKFTFYVLKGMPLLELFYSLYRETLEKSIHVKCRKEKNGIYFSTLENIFENGPDAKFRGLDNAISLNELSK
jgi:hypothetical protein